MRVDWRHRNPKHKAFVLYMAITLQVGNLGPLPQPLELSRVQRRERLMCAAVPECRQRLPGGQNLDRPPLKVGGGSSWLLWPNCVMKGSEVMEITGKEEGEDRKS